MHVAVSYHSTLSPVLHRESVRISAVLALGINCLHRGSCFEVDRLVDRLAAVDRSHSLWGHRLVVRVDGDVLGTVLMNDNSNSSRKDSLHSL